MTQKDRKRHCQSDKIRRSDKMLESRQMLKLFDLKAGEPSHH
jgi:hypothetical protein